MDARSEQFPGRAPLEHVEQCNCDALSVAPMHGAADSRRSFVPVLPEPLHGFTPTPRRHRASVAHGGAGARLWFAARDRLEPHWRRLRPIVPYLIALALPGSLVWLPLLALWQQWQRRQRTRA